MTKQIIAICACILFFSCEFADLTKATFARLGVTRLTLSGAGGGNANTPPVAVDDFKRTVQGTDLSVMNPNFGVLGNDMDAERDTLMVTMPLPTPATTPSTAEGGEIIFDADGTYTYTPLAGFDGTDTVEYTVSDGVAEDTATLSIEVTLNMVANTAPVANDDDNTTGQDVELSVTSRTNGVLANDVDDDRDTLAVTMGTGPTDERGTITFAADGTYTYTPPTGFVGTDTVEYTVSDSIAEDTATLSIEVTLNMVANTGPVANPDTATTQQGVELSVTNPNIGVLANDTDADGDTLEVTMGTAANGTIIFNVDGTYTYTPLAGFVGTDTVEYTVSDGTDTATATLSIEVTLNMVANTGPVANPDTSRTTPGIMLSVTDRADGVLANDTDVDGDVLEVTMGTAANGTITFDADGTYAYTPPADRSIRTDTVQYTVSDGVAEATGTLSITINTQPVANDDTDPLNGVLENDTDADGDQLSVIMGTGPTDERGTITFDAGGTYTYTQPAGFVGTDTVEYTITDGTDTATATLSITVTPPPPPYIPITDAAGLAAIANDLTETYKLENNIDLTGNFEPIGSLNAAFTGEFDGGGHTIRGLQIDKTRENCVGLFRKVGTGGVIKNLTLELANGNEQNPSVRGNHGVGALVGCLEDNARVESVTVRNGYVSGGNNGLGVGGLVGAMLPRNTQPNRLREDLTSKSNTEIANSHAEVGVSGRQYVGGLVGANTGTIERSSATGVVKARRTSGGLVGINTKDITQSHATRNVRGTESKLGGLVGINNGSIERSYAEGEVSNGGAGTRPSEIGGLVGDNNGRIETSYATGRVVGGNYVGGLVGINDGASGSIERSYATGRVDATRNDRGGLSGSSRGRSIADNYFDARLTGRDTGTRTTNNGTTPYYTHGNTVHEEDRSTAPIITENSFQNWNFNDVWEMTPGQWPTHRQ